MKSFLKGVGNATNLRTRKRVSIDDPIDLPAEILSDYNQLQKGEMLLVVSSPRPVRVMIALRNPVRTIAFIGFVSLTIGFEFFRAMH